MKKILGFAAAVALGISAIVALAAFRGHFHRDPAEMAAFVSRRVDDALDDLDATPQQRTQIHALVDKLVADAQKLRAGRQEVRKELVAQWDAETPDRARIHAIVDQQVDQLRAMAHEAADAAVDAHGILNADQRARISKKLHRHLEQ
jgi:Spy/CpxP family protein refolding chaperone